MAREERESTQRWNTPGQKFEEIGQLGNAQHPGAAEVDHRDDAESEEKNHNLLKSGPVSRRGGLGERIRKHGSDQSCHCRTTR